MRPAHLAAIGLALAGLSRLYIFAIAAPELGATPFVLLLLAVGAGLLAGAAGSAALPGPRGARLMAAGLSLAALGAAARVLLDLRELELPGSVLIAIGLCQAAWMAALGSAEMGTRAPARAAALQVSFVAVLLGAAWYLALRVGDPLRAPGPVLFALGAALAVAGFGALRADAPGPATAPADA